jgi:hypothetical protein
MSPWKRSKSRLCLMKKLVLLLVFLFFTPLTLGVSLRLLEDFQTKPSGQILSANHHYSSPQIYAAQPPPVGTLSTEIETGDARPEIIRQYLETHQSPLLPYADLIFEVSQEYQLDYRLMVAIAQCESNLCKKSPEGSFNCWGFENGATEFLSWEQAIGQVAKTLKERYYDQGLITPEEIMPKYAPPAVENGGSWAKCVNQFFEELK